MRLGGMTSRLFGSPWGRILGGALSAILLFPLPGLALTFLTPWSLIRQVQKGGALAAKGVNFVDSIMPGGLRAAVQLDDRAATNTSPGRSRSTVVIERDFKVDQAGAERLQLQPLVSGDFKDAGYSVKVLIGHSQGGRFRVDETFPAFGQQATSAVRVFQGRTFRSHLLRGAPGRTYEVRVSITYFKGRHGFWHGHVAQHGSASFHRFGT
jgi:hypothetical protein